ncbi:MAG TPA: DUF885 domain-containing protein [Pseudonocardiaceae bacterium]|nr:DUF885 domain-containing protein [Pseudonocardiaceae bacterium]
MPNPDSPATNPVDALADELVALTFAEEPLSATLLGLPGAHDELSDLSAESEATFRARYADLAERAVAVEADSERDRVTKAVIIQQARTSIDQIDSRLIEYTVTDLFVAPASGLLTVLPMIGLADPALADAYLDRLAAVPRYLTQAADRHRAGIAAGRLPVAHLVDGAIRQLDRYLADPAADPLRRPTPPAEAAGFQARRDQLLDDVVRPGFAAYRDALRVDVLPHGRPADRPGLCWLPDGDATYAALARAHTSTGRSADDLHDTGLALIDGLAKEYAEIGARVFDTADVTEIFHRLRTDSTLRWGSGDELLDAARAAIARAVRAAPAWFGRVPDQPCEVRAVPEHEAAGAPPAYYMQPSMDGRRPGVYFANTDRVTERFRHTLEATAFHEAVPGHHFQLSIAQELNDLPLLRRIAKVTSYTEGWGLYSERLADEMGLYSDDVAKLGMLTTDSMRAGRLVVDTGLHAKGWSRQQAIDYLLANTPMSKVEIETEVDRYIAYPGQALAYMVGRLEIQRAREEARRRLGDRFDIRAFHDLVLGGGALPLSVLAEVVGEWAGAPAS